ncbi:MAG TPA: coproporphyrinogen-III oxidase family protein [Gaiellaceae bacterium]
MSGATHLYVHVPFCEQRCDYCDFVSLAGRRDRHARYVEALLAELKLELGTLAPELESVYLGGGTPTFLEPQALRRLLEGLPAAGELTVEANPETVTAELAELLVEAGVNRVSLGAQSFQPRLLEVLGRHAGPDEVRRAVAILREAGVDNISLDLLYGIPGQSGADLAADLDAALALAPEHLSCYELEAKPGTRFARAYGAELAAQADALEDHLERIIERLPASGYRWYETANFARVDGERDLRSATSDRNEDPSTGCDRWMRGKNAGSGRSSATGATEDIASRRRARSGDGVLLFDARSKHNLGYWRGHDYLGIGIGAVSTLGDLRWKNAPSLARYFAALEAGEKPPRETEALDEATKLRERLMLGLRLDEPVAIAQVERVLDRGALARLSKLGLVESDGESMTLSTRGRFLGGAVSAELIVWPGDSLAA